jgi:AraC family transcriptional regulator
MNAPRLESWHARLCRAAQLLSQRLDNPPSLDELAAAAAVSPYHFHRIWRGLTGETVGHTVARLRIEAAKPQLAHGARVTDVAMALGFGTPQSFARAFRSQTGTTPSAYAAQGEPALATPAQVPAADVRLVVQDGVRVVALRQQGGAYIALNHLFQRVWDWAETAGHLETLTGLYGIPFDDPGSVDEAQLRYAACLALGDVQPPAPFERIELPTGPHAVARHLGSYDGLEACTQALVGHWLPRSGHEPADRPVYYHFYNDPEMTPEPELVTEVLLALQPAPG